MMRNRLPLILLLLAVALPLVTAGCNRTPKKRVLVPDHQFSVNLVSVPPDWPDEDKDWPDDVDMALRQQRTYERHGPPDFFRIRWNRDGRIIPQGELQQKLMADRQRDLEKYMKELSLEHEWVYVDKGKIFRFQRSGVEERELPDTIRILSEFGDPADIKETRDVGGPVTVYTYYDRGKLFSFREGTLFREENIPAMPLWGGRQ